MLQKAHKKCIAALLYTAACVVAHPKIAHANLQNVIKIGYYYQWDRAYVPDDATKDSLHLSPMLHKYKTQDTNNLQEASIVIFGTNSRTKDTEETKNFCQCQKR